MKFRICGLLLAAATAMAAPAAAENGPTITEAQAVAETLAAAPELKASAAARRAADGARAQAAVRPNPTLQFEAENIAGSDPFNGFNGGEYTYSLGQKIERGGKRSARVAVAEANEDIARWREARDGLDVVYDVRAAYAEVMAAAASLALAKDQHALAIELEVAVRRRVASARDPEAALLRVKARALEFETDRNIAEAELLAAKERLSSYWGDPRADFEVETAPLFATGRAVAAPAGAIDDTPDVALLEAGESLASATVRLEEANAKQDPTIGFGVRHLTGEDAVAGMVSFTMPIALFDTNRGAIAAARAERNRAEWTKRAAMLRLSRELKAVAAQYGAALQEARAVREIIIPQAESALAAARRGYDRGAFTYLEVIDAQRAVAELKSREIAALARVRQAEIALDRLTGRKAEGWESVQ